MLLREKVQEYYINHQIIKVTSHFTLIIKNQASDLKSIYTFKYKSVLKLNKMH